MPFRDHAKRRTLPALGLALTMLAGCGEHGKTVDREPPAVRLPTTVVQRADLPDFDAIPGAVTSDDRVDISSRVTGYVLLIAVHEGQSVRRGQVLARIDAREIDEAIRQARAGLSAAQADLAHAEEDVVAQEPLAQTGAISRDVFRGASLRRDVARSTVAKAQAALGAAEAQRSYVTIASPIDGVIVARPGQAGALATPGRTLVTVEARRRLLFKMFVPEADVRRIAVDAPIEVRLDGLGDRTLSGVVRGIVPSGDTTTRRYEVDIALPPDPGLMPGMFGRARLVTGRRQSPRVPASAIVERGGLTGVFVVGKDGRVAFRWLRTGKEADGYVEIASGLVGGETILARADASVRDGARLVQGPRTR
jgi:RND family efflux transporter MFP subunit